MGSVTSKPGAGAISPAKEASRARSGDEFVSKLGGAIQEADESQLWLELLRDDCAICDQALDALHREAGELIAIFVTMIKRTRGKT